MRPLNVIDLGIQLYEDVLFLQRKILAEKRQNRNSDYLLLVEHPNIFTIGRTGTRENILVDENLLDESGLKAIEVDRGGDITFHGIGQLVAYPIFDLRNHIKDIRLFIRNIERVLEFTVAEYGLIADRKKRYTGLWIDGEKIGFIGIGISNWITYHGISINANVDLKYFSMIKPCGIDNLKISSLKKILKRDIDLNLLKGTLTEKFCEVFEFEYSNRSLEDAFLAKEEAS